MDGAYPYPESIPPQPGPGNPTFGAPFGGPPPAYPTTLPPAVEYPSGGGNNKKRILLVVGAVVQVEIRQAHQLHKAPGLVIPQPKHAVRTGVDV